MKEKDLMIGDKVMVKVLSQIPNTYVLHTWTANDYSRDIQVKPIPLTPEILEKNGWHFDLTPYEKDLNECCGMSIDKHWCYADTNIDISLFLPITGLEMGRLEVHNHHLKRYLEFWICDTLYVHEMQHALRLCGLNELADNFKV